jgi:hypothetical protein
MFENGDEVVITRSYQAAIEGDLATVTHVHGDGNCNVEVHTNANGMAISPTLDLFDLPKSYLKAL